MSDKPQEKSAEKDLNAAKYLLRGLTAKHYEDAWTAKNNGEKIGWCASKSVRRTFPRPRNLALLLNHMFQPFCMYMKSFFVFGAPNFLLLKILTRPFRPLTD